jgi:NAD(P)-dependent dehydrogenase (short-subunit alcohol dehydrogenase family)
MADESTASRKRTVLVVTGASRGIGAAIARLGAARGYDVAINFRNDAAAAEAVAAAIRAAGGVAETFQGDVSDDHAVEAMFALIERRLGRPGVLINNAGISGGVRAFTAQSPATLRDVIATNLLGAFYCSQAAVRRMSRSQGGTGGSIVNISSQAGQYGGNLISAYAASKAGLNAFTLGLARELAAEGIRVNAVSPGVIDTGIHADAEPARREAALASIPMRRAGLPEEVAQAALWLASDEASYITGTVVAVAGGR